MTSAEMIPLAWLKVFAILRHWFVILIDDNIMVREQFIL